MANDLNDLNVSGSMVSSRNITLSGIEPRPFSVSIYENRMFLRPVRQKYSNERGRKIWLGMDHAVSAPGKALFF